LADGLGKGRKLPAVRESTWARGSFVAALGFDRQTDTVVRTAVALAKRFDLEVHVVNVTESMLYEPMIGDLPGYYTIPGLVAEREQELVDQRQKDLEKIQDQMLSHVPCTVKAVIGDTVRTLIAEAETRRANFVLTACNPSEYRLLYRGFSTALGLMHEAPLPVLTVSDETPLDLDKRGVKILVADDLRESTGEAVRKAYELAGMLQAPVIRQVHVHGDFRELIRDYLQDLKERTPGLRGSNGQTLESLWSDEYQLRKDRLAKHGSPFRASAEQAGALVELDVRTGAVHEQLHAAVQEFEPDLLVFGRHRILRAKPFLVGRMTAKAMLEEKKPVLSVPAETDLYAKLPFPGARA